MHPENDLIESFTGLLIFEVAGREYCLSDAMISSIVKGPFRIKRSNKGRRGNSPSLEVNGNIIPLINLRNLFDHSMIKESITDASRVIIVDCKDQQCGLLVDSIKEMIALDSRYISDCIIFRPRDELHEDLEGRNFLEGSLEIENRCILLLNIDPITSIYYKQH